MEYYWVEGLFVTAKGVKKAKKSGKFSPADIEPFAKAIWANGPDEALQTANEALNGGEWTDGPTVSKITEEQRMRSLGAPELPGFSTSAQKHKRK